VVGFVDKELIHILEILNKNSAASQRQIADEAGISIGKINSMIKELTVNGYIDIEKVSRKPHYKVSKLGIEALENFLKTTYDKKILIEGIENKQIKQAVILAAGERKEFTRPVGLLDVDGCALIQRAIDILKENGIEKIVVVTGYKSELYEQYFKDSSIMLIKNEKYKWTGTMPSLAMVEQIINDDFILVESDMVYEERAITEVLESKIRDCVLITSESGSGDEAYVEIRNGYLFKMSKDKHQFNRIHGEMIGISKISIDIFKKMLEEFKYNTNPYINYEYTLLDVGRSYNIGCVKIDDLVWSEIDNLEHYEKINNYIFPKLKRKEMEIKTQNIRNYIVEALNVSENEIGDIVPSGGMTNKNYKVSIKNKNYVLRVPGAGTEEMISRPDEKINASLAHELGLDTKVLYFDEKTGIKIAEFIEEAETLNGMTAKREDNMKLTTDILKKLHCSDIALSSRFDVFEKIEHYEKLLKAANGKNFSDYDVIKNKVMGLKDLLQQLDMQLLPCHNDTVPENFIKGKSGRIYLIDWEYSGMNDPMWDLAAHSLECSFSEDDEELFLRLYFGNMPEEKYIKRILIHKICQDFLWSIWTNIKEAKGDDFGTYGIDRYNRAKRNLEKIYN
jgi:thiamine kinase-like enzyme/choline kinase/predicted transcriptional regulator